MSLTHRIARRVIEEAKDVRLDVDVFTVPITKKAALVLLREAGERAQVRQTNYVAYIYIGPAL